MFSLKGEEERRVDPMLEGTKWEGAVTYEDYVKAHRNQNPHHLSDQQLKVHWYTDLRPVARSSTAKMLFPLPPLSCRLYAN